MVGSKVMKLREVSERTGVPEATLRWWRHVDRGPKSFTIGRRVAYLESDVAAWLAGQYSTGVRGGDAA